MKNLLQSLTTHKPFRFFLIKVLQWVFGHSNKVPIINTTSNGNNGIKSFLSVSGQVFQNFICDGNKNKTNCFVGHVRINYFQFIAVTRLQMFSFYLLQEHQIIALETDSTGRFIVSADESGVINVWDVKVIRY